ncbi:flagellin N-terminal helical domain-containing protein [Paracoccus niistensis]|uniref:Flagellin n=1 Tax=Paracoccus niistensis TaxID=632935 RepID=A0ABV6I2U1_9RHOB
MSSILTNNGAMVALQTLKGINAGLAKTQDEISTGKSVATAKDNAAVWAISKVMEADVSGFKAISSGLATAGQTVGMAREGAEQITGLLTKMRDTIVTSQNATNAQDRAKLQEDVTNLKAQIEGVVKGSQVNGLNLLDGSTTSVDFLSSLDRSSTGVSTSNINVSGKNLSTGGYVAKDIFGAGTAPASAAGDSAVMSLGAGDTTGVTLVIGAGAGSLAAGDSVSIRIGDKTATYTVSAADAGSTTPNDVVAVGLKSAIEKLGISGVSVDYDSGTAGQLTIKSGTVPATTNDLNITAQFRNAGAGGLGALAGLDVTTPANAQAALASIETMMQASTNAAASFGAAGRRIEMQSDFVSKLTDTLKSSVGALVDADMEEASARLQALQTQQQLGIQSLSIANKAPQNILSLFRG